MKKKIFLIFIFFAFAIVLFGLFSLKHIFKVKEFDESRAVYIKKIEKGYQLIRNGEPFYINGVSGYSHLKQLAELGGNTIRLYDTLDLKNTLDEAQEYGLAVIVDIPIPAFYYAKKWNEDEIIDMKQNVSSLVLKYKNHQALLMWNLGNEVNYPKVSWKDFLMYKRFRNKRTYRRFYNELIKVIHSEDKNHPVSTSTWDSDIVQFFNISLFSPELDIISYNTFGGIKGTIQRINNWEKWLGTFPYFISEFGPNGWWSYEQPKYTSWNSPIEQTSSKKAVQVMNRYNFILNDKNCIGSLVFFWGYRYECTHTWFSLFIDSYKSEVLKDLGSAWNHTGDEPELIGINYMLVDEKGAMDNIILTSNKEIHSELIFDDDKNSFKDRIIKWEIYADVWFDGLQEEKYNTKKMDPPEPMNCSLHSYDNYATFRTPEIEGPYRIFAYVFDKDGYFATTNTPFYVLNP